MIEIIGAYYCVLYETALISDSLKQAFLIAGSDTWAVEFFRRRWGRHLRSVSRRDGPAKLTTIFHASEDHG